MAYSWWVRFVETPVFTTEIERQLPPDEYRALQHALMLRPESGSLIPGGGGLRKLRWLAPGRGKRGGSRVIYYWYRPEELIYLLYFYRKSEQDDLTSQQLKTLKHLVEENLP